MHGTRPNGSTKSMTAHVIATVAALTYLGAVPDSSLAQTRLTEGHQGNVRRNDPNHRSYVRDYRGGLVATDRRYVQDVMNTWRGERVYDVAMQQCFGGGFVHEFEEAIPPNNDPTARPSVTISSATRFDHPASSELTEDWIRVGAPGSGIFRRRVREGVDDYTRAWNEDAYRNTASLWRRAETTLNTRGAVPLLGVLNINAYGGSRVTENRVQLVLSQYYSRENNDNNAANASWRRTLQHANDRPQYAILVCWDDVSEDDELRVDTNFDPARVTRRPELAASLMLVRTYRTIRDVYGVPAANIVVLYRGNARASRLPTFTTVAPASGPNNTHPAIDLRSGDGVFVDGPNTRANWLAALHGDLFSPAWPGNLPNDDPRRNARIFVFNCGHGGQGDLDGLRKDFGRNHPGLLAYDTRPGRFDKSTASIDSGVFGSTFSDCLLQVTTRRPLTDPQNVIVKIDQHAATGGLIEVAPAMAYELGEFLPDGPMDGFFHYQIMFSDALFDPALGPSGPIQVDLEGVDDPDTGHDLVAAMLFRNGWQEYAAASTAGRQHDGCDGAATIHEGVYPADFTIATPDPAAPCGPQGLKDVWFRYQASLSGMVTIKTCGLTDLDTILSVQAVCGGGLLACNDNACETQSSVTLAVTEGSAYLVRLAAASDGLAEVSIAFEGPVGACCTGIGCSEMTVSECAAAGGTYQGDGSTCGYQPGDRPAPTCPSFVSFGPRSFSPGISDDGRSVIGYTENGSTRVAVRWALDGSSESFPDSPGGLNDAWFEDCSASGSIVVGRIHTSSGSEAAFAMGQCAWSSLTPGGEPLDAARATAVSADGLTMAGRGTSGLGTVAFIKRLDGVIEQLGDLSGGLFESFATGISADGNVVVGRANSTEGPEGFRWQAGSMLGLGDLPGGAYNSLANGVSGDGSVIVGRASDNDGAKPVRWLNGSILTLIDTGSDDLTDGALAANSDGSIIVGRGILPDGPDEGQHGEFVWSESSGLISLRGLLESNGIDLTGWTLIQARGISADGAVVSGNAINPQGQPEAWAACLPPLPTGRCCPCDWNGVSCLDSQDFFDFLNDFFNGDADINGSDGTDSQDFFDFLACFFNGC